MQLRRASQASFVISGPGTTLKVTIGR